MAISSDSPEFGEFSRATEASAFTIQVRTCFGTTNVSGENLQQVQQTANEILESHLKSFHGGEKCSVAAGINFSR